MRVNFRFYFCLVVIFFSGLSSADLVIEVTDWVKDPTKIAIVPFQNKGRAVQQDIAAVIAADLTRSGQFSVLDRDDMLSSPSHADEVHFRDWRALGVDYLLIGRSENRRNKMAVKYTLFDVHTQRELLEDEIRDGRDAERAIAHKLSDAVFKKLTGIRGVFSTRMLYVSVQRNELGVSSYRLILADADGANWREILRSAEPILSPAWSADGKQIAYVSFETQRPAIYQQVIATGQRKKLTNFPGLNSAPAWSPDGKHMAMVLSKDGNPDIYLMNLATAELQKITHHSAIDTEPSWLPDGQSLIFTSDRGGKPQIYQFTLADKKVKRLTFKGRYNARASVMPNGKSIVMVHGDEQGYHIARQELATGRLLILTSSSLDESPSIAPNGTMLLYATKYAGRGVLAAVSLDGGIKFRLPSPSSDVREPAWSPY
ncbi:MAG: Tol-Pal system beta propeller repeat protein TolB [Cellvibrionales bacterium]|nr:Tol-Pal system beta propeller repeat protein TolB [Cellvibrionales bacterium]